MTNYNQAIKIISINLSMLTILSWGTCFNKTKKIHGDAEFDLLQQEFHDLITKVFAAHDTGFNSFSSSSVRIKRLISMWVSLEKNEIDFE